MIRHLVVRACGRNSSARASSIIKQLPRHVGALDRATSSSLLRGANRTMSSAATTASNATTAMIKPWPVPMIESDGDYTKDTYIESHIGGPLYSVQSTLPRLPVPPVDATVDEFLPTAIPLAESADEARTLEERTGTFPSDSVTLQQRLEARARDDFPDSSWLQKWWNQLGYLQVRDPIVVNVSYFFHLADDLTLPPPPPSPTTTAASPSASSAGVKRGAAILYSSAEYRRMVVTGQLPYERIGKPTKKQTPLCSTAFKYMFNSCRIPHRTQDGYRMYDPSLHRHVIVARGGQFYSVDFVDEDGDPLPLAILEGRLAKVVEMADAEGVEDAPPHLGWLTSNDRDTWADDREDLLRVGGDEMRLALERLESGAFLLCLDDEEPVSRKQCGETFWTGGKYSGHNRWFDKSVQIFVSNNGKTGMMGEHSMMDGMPLVGFADHVVNATYADVVARSGGDGGVGAAVDGVENVFASCAPMLNSSLDGVVRSVSRAKQALETLVGDHDLHVQSFQAYGADAIKKMGYSPDAFVQMAIQLATYRLFSKQAATYEATQTRVFLHGRTETTRSVSPASAAFVRRMGLRRTGGGDDAASDAEKVALLQKAVASHVRYIGKAAKGMGVDRHFLGLSLLAADAGNDPTPDLFSDPLFVRSKTWRVSTSHLTHPKFENWGFGEVVPDGVGVGYAVKGGCCVFNLTARREHGWTETLSHLLEEALLEMRDLHSSPDPARLASKL